MSGPVFDDSVANDHAGGSQVANDHAGNDAVAQLHVENDDGSDVLDLGAPRRAGRRAPRRRGHQLSPRRRTILASTAAVVVVAAAITVAVVQAGGRDDGVTVAGPAGTTPPVATTTVAGNGDVNGGGPQLLVVGGRPQLSVLGGGPFGSSPQLTDLVEAPTVVAALQDRLPGFEATAGGRVADPDVHYGIFITGHLQNAAGVEATLTVYSAKAAGTTPSSDQLVTRVDQEGRPATRTEVSMFTGTGWWVHLLAQAPLTDAGPVDEVPTLLALAADQRLTS